MVRYRRLDEQLELQPGLAAKLDWLVSNRLVSMMGPLHARNLIQDSVVRALGPFSNRLGIVSDEQLAEERRVLASLARSDNEFLVLKGALLGWTLYPGPERRFRTDLDILTDERFLDSVRGELKSLGYRRSIDMPGGSPMSQEQWVTDRSGGQFLVDLHWELRNHPVLNGLFAFSELYAARQQLEMEGTMVPGLGRAHALIHGAMHWFDDLGQDRPLVWLFDLDLLWRAMSDEERSSMVELSTSRGLAGLVGECLVACRETLDTPVAAALCEDLCHAGVGQRPTRLIAARQSKWKSYWFALQCEPDWHARARRLRLIFFPPVKYIRSKYPFAPGWTIPWLYLKRLVTGGKGRF